MKRFTVLLAGTLIAAGSIESTEAEARGRRDAAVAAGVIGGLAVGALVGSALSARAAPVYTYERRYYRPPVVVHHHHYVDEYGYGYPNDYDDDYGSGYREGYRDGQWDGD